MPEPMHLDLTLESVSCPVCGDNDPRPVLRAPDFETHYTNEFQVVRCRACGMIYTSPRPSMDDLFRYFYHDNYVCYTHSGLADTLRETYLCAARFKALKHLIPETGRFLDVGCSHGYFLDYVKTRSRWEASGCEPSAEMAERAKKRGLDVVNATLVQAAYPDKAFDLVYMSHVLEHVPDLADTVREVFRILKPGGLFITENPDVDAPIRKPFGPCWWGWHLPRHLSHFSRNSMTRLLTDHGFEVKSVKPCFRPGPIAWSIQNRLKRRKAPAALASFFGVHNPLFVAFCGLPGLIYLKGGHTDMMETRAVKPLESL
ncbi:class I SAM-dependent methyltransferase [Desulfatiferula olefinivorans]